MPPAPPQHVAFGRQGGTPSWWEPHRWMRTATPMGGDVEARVLARRGPTWGAFAAARELTYTRPCARM
eukprot:2427711-Lingulodinium_polyedra.AAC.1